MKKKKIIKVITIITILSIIVSFVIGPLVLNRSGEPVEIEKTESSSGSGNVITTIKDTDNTNLVENKSASGKDESYRWEVELGRGTTYYFGLQEKEGIRPVVKMRNKDGWFVRYQPQVQSSKFKVQSYVEPKVDGNSIEWEIAPGITARYTALKDRIKADYIVDNKKQLCFSSVIASGAKQSHPQGIATPPSEARNDNGCGLDFLVQYNDSYAGDDGEGIKEGRGYLKHELLPGGSIAWLMENGMSVFDMPAPVIQECKVQSAKCKVTVESSKLNNNNEAIEQSNNDPSFNIQKTGTGTSLLSIVLPDNVEYPLVIDPVVVDSAAAATATAYGNGRKILKDQYGNLIMLCDCGTGAQNVWYRNKLGDNVNVGVWTDAAIDLDGGAGAAVEISGDIDSAGNIQISWRDASDDIIYEKLTVTRSSSGNITSIASAGQVAIETTGSLDTTPITRRPSLIVANKGDGPGKEKIAVAWTMNSTGGGTKRGEIRFAQCDVADTCTTAANWKNASEEVTYSGTCTDGTAGVPNADNCAGAADVLFQFIDHTTNHAVLTQVPGRPARTPMRNGAFKDIGGTLTALTNAIDDNIGTTADVNSLTTTDYIYVGDTVKFSRIVADITNTNANAQTFTTRQSCSANSDVNTPCDTWTALFSFIDNTATATVAFSQDGSILFEEASNWVESTEGPAGSTAKGFWVRLRPGGAFDATVSIAEFDITDRHSKDLLLVGGSPGTSALGTAYVIWDFMGQAGWENNPADADDPWRVGDNSIDSSGANWSLCTNFPLTVTLDVINNNVYVAYVVAGAACTGPTTVKSHNNTLSITDANWTNTSFPAVTEAADIVLSLTSDQSDIYLFYVLDPDTNSLVWRKCTPTDGTSQACDSANDWGAENTLSTFSTGAEEPSHPQAVVSKAYGDTVAIDVVYTNLLATAEVKYERHFVDMADITEVVVVSGDDAYHRDCDTGTDDQDIASAAARLGRGINDGGCSGGVNSDNHAGFRFESVNVAQGARISSAYLDFRVDGVTGTGNVGQYSSIACPSADDCKIAFYDATNTALLFYDCDDSTCSTGTVTTLDGATGCVLTSCSTTAAVGQYTSISCPTATDCKISYYATTNTALKFADCDTATCSSGTVNLLDSVTGCVLTSCNTIGNIGQYTSISCPTATDCKISYYDVDLRNDLKFADCDTATCSSGTVTSLDGLVGCVLTSCSTVADVGAYTSISCPTATDCKISYYDTTNTALKFADCDTATCSTGAVSSLDGVTGCVLTSCSTTDAVGTYTSISCPTATDCKISYYDTTNTALKFADCDTATCSTGAVSSLDGVTGCVLTSCSTTDAVGQYTSISCPTATDCKISYYDTSNTALKFADCDTATCSSGTATLVDANANCLTTTCLGNNVGQYSSIACPTADDCKIAFYDATTTALLFYDCDNATCSSGTVNLLDGATGCVLTSCSTTADVGQYTSINCPTATDCKISYYDTTNSALKFADCDTATCSSGTVSSLDGVTGCSLTSCSTTDDVGLYTSIACPTATDCKISYYDLTNTDLKFADCDTATCSSGAVSRLDGSGACVLTGCTATDLGAYTSISCPTATDCKISYYDSASTGLKFADCDTATCSSGAVSRLDGVFAAGCVLTSCSTTASVGTYTSISCPTATDCKISYYDTTNTALKFADCDTATCSSGTATTVESTNDVGQYTSIACPTADDCKIAYYDVTFGNLKFADCDTATCSTSTLTTVAWIKFTIYGEDVNSAVTDGTAFDSLTNCTDPCTGSIRTLTRTTSKVDKTMDFRIATYRIDVTDVIQEIVCRGASNAQPCVGDFNGAGTWAANNNLALLLIPAGIINDRFATIVSQDATGTVMLDPTLQINCAGSGCGTGNPRINYSMGVIEPPTGSGDLDHPMSASQFGQVTTDDTLYASVSASFVASASPSATPTFMFKVNNANNNNTDRIRATVIFKTNQAGFHARSPTHLQVYRGGSYNGWITLVSSAVNMPTDTDITMNSPPILTNLSDYYNAESGPNLACSSSSANCWVYFRIYQDPPTDNFNEVLYVDYFNVTFANFSDANIQVQVRGGTRIQGGSRIQ